MDTMPTKADLCDELLDLILDMQEFIDDELSDRGYIVQNLTFLAIPYNEGKWKKVDDIGFNVVIRYELDDGASVDTCREVFIYSFNDGVLRPVDGDCVNSRDPIFDTDVM